MIWEKVRKTGMLAKAMVSCHPRVGTPSTLIQGLVINIGIERLATLTAERNIHQITNRTLPVLQNPITSMCRVGPIGRSLQVRQEKEGFIQSIILGQTQHCPVQSNKDGNLDNGGDASGKWIDLILLVYLGDFLVHYLGVGCIFGLEGLDGGLECL